VARVFEPYRSNAGCTAVVRLRRPQGLHLARPCVPRTGAWSIACETLAQLVDAPEAALRPTFGAYAAAIRSRPRTTS